MKRLALLVLVLIAGRAYAEEGMWRPKQIPELGPELKALGSQVDPNRFSDLLGDPMGAVIHIPGCTASFVSPDGLIVTNHHCASSTLQYLSDETHNYVRDGYLAHGRSGELRARPGTYAWVAVQVSNVTSDVLAAVPGGTHGRERFKAIEKKDKELISACEKEPGYRCSIRSYNGGLEYELIKQLEIRDVRLVYSPPDAIGDYGGDVDNWMWPRHTGDFTFFRAYVGRDGKPADYSAENVPYKPKHWLRVSPDGVRKGSLVFVAGYPGRTSRYRLAAEVEDTFEWSYPTRKRLYDQWIENIEKVTSHDETAAIKYSFLLSMLNNSEKNYGGMIDGYAKSDLLAKKRKLEADLADWIKSSPERERKYGSAISDLAALVAKESAHRERELYYDNLAHRSALLGAAVQLYRLAVEKEKPDMERKPQYQARNWKRIGQFLERIPRMFDPKVDRSYYRQFVLNYAANVPVPDHAPAYDAWFGIEGSHVDEAKLDARLDQMYSATRLSDKDVLLGWMDRDKAAFQSSDDPFIQLAVKMLPHDLELEAADEELEGQFDEVRPRYMEALIAFYRSLGKPVYPDANGTLRVTYGTVTGYSPRDAVSFTPFTTLKGLLEKETGKSPFDTPKEELALIRQGKFGRYEDPALGSVPIDFLSTVDTTGGNSGSPTLNAKGELVGLLFDGVWESIIADWDFLPKVTRSIHLDARYMLWVLDDLAGAHDLVSEMGIKSGLGGAAPAASR